jgi:hypothetical protein
MEKLSAGGRMMRKKYLVQSGKLDLEQAHAEWENGTWIRLCQNRQCLAALRHKPDENPPCPQCGQTTDWQPTRVAMLKQANGPSA